MAFHHWFTPAAVACDTPRADVAPVYVVHQWRPAPQHETVLVWSDAGSDQPVSVYAVDDHAAIAARLRELGQGVHEAEGTPGIASFSSMGPTGPAEATHPAAISISSPTYIQTPHPRTPPDLNVVGPPAYDFSGDAWISDACIQTCTRLDGDV